MERGPRFPGVVPAKLREDESTCKENIMKKRITFKGVEILRVL